MGYTNYYDVNAKLNLTCFPEEFLTAVRKIVENSPVPICGWDSDKLDEKPLITETEIAINGVAEDGSDSFNFTPNQTTWLFCKTDAKPYDMIVKAILLYAERHTNLLTKKFTFDGKRHDNEFRRAVRYLKKLGLY